MNINIYWGNILRDARKSKHLSQKEVADIIHVSRATYSQYETGRLRPTPEVIAVLSNIYEKNLLDYALACFPKTYLDEQEMFKTHMPLGPRKKENIRKKNIVLSPPDDDIDINNLADFDRSCTSSDKSSSIQK